MSGVAMTKKIPMVFEQHEDGRRSLIVGGVDISDAVKSAKVHEEEDGAQSIVLTLDCGKLSVQAIAHVLK